jgi:hypothetical protein
MKMLRRLFDGRRVPRGLSQTATLVIAIVIILVAWPIVRMVIGTVVSLLHLAIELGVLIIAVLAIMWVIKFLSKKSE